jgi:hypothetical protein
VQDGEKEVSSAASKFMLKVECRLPICDVKPIFEVATWVIYPPNLPTWVTTLHCCSVRYNLVSILGTHFQKMGLPKTTIGHGVGTVCPLTDPDVSRRIRGFGAAEPNESARVTTMLSFADCMMALRMQFADIIR